MIIKVHTTYSYCCGENFYNNDNIINFEAVDKCESIRSVKGHTRHQDSSI